MVLLCNMIFSYGTRNFNAHKDAGIPGPKPWPFIGTMHLLYYYGIYDYTPLMKKKYGKVVGTYSGTSPSYIFYDEEMITKVMVKQFPDFINRRTFRSGDPVTECMLTSLEDERWKFVRSTMSPSFTSGKLRGMCKEINRCARQFADSVTSKGGPVEMREFAASFTMDVIASTAFGLRVNSQVEEGNAFATHGRKIADIGLRSPLIILLFLLPQLRPLLARFRITMFDRKAMDFFLNVFEQTLKGRQEGDKTHTDFIQLMVNAQKGERIHDDNDAGEVENLGAKSSAGITHNEILGNALIFLFAGYDTTSLGLTQLLYCLAINPECQDKLYEEIETHVGDKSELDYEVVNKLQYLDQCLQESLRMYPPAPFLDRKAKRDTEVCGIKIKKDTIVSIPAWAVHHDPEIWPEPEKFDPDRFTPEAKKGRSGAVWLPFGIGPRNCIGMRLALMEIKMAVIQLLRSHKVVRCEKTEVPLKFSPSKFLQAVNGVWIGIEKR